MRSSRDRVRHTLFFELGMLLLCSPIAAVILDRDIAHIGMVALSLSLIAMGVNYLYNLFFDLALLKLGLPVHKRSAKLRVLHAALFEFVLLLVSIPVVALSLQMTFLQALITDMGFALFALSYTYVFNWGYDWLFPVPVGEPIYVTSE